MQIISLPIDTLKPSPYQPREELDQNHVRQLAESIRLVGIQEPLQVTPNCEGFWIITGHHRHAAAILADVKELPCQVVEGDETRLHLMASLTNDARLEEKPMEQASAYARLLETMEKSDLARAIAKPTSFIERRLVLLKLDRSIQKLVDSGNIPLTLAEMIAELPTEYEQVKAVAICKSLELTAAKAAVSQLLAASQNVGMFAEFELSAQEQDKRQKAARAFEERLAGLDKAIGQFTKDDYSMAAGILDSPEKHLAYLEAASKEIKRLQDTLLAAKGILAAGGQETASTFVGMRLRELRQSRALSIRELAARAGVPFPNLSRLENGKTRPQPSTIRRLAEALRVEPAALMS